ncbi:MAG: serine hydrolase domain-containing protein [Nakamurella sp.]
MVDRGPVPCRRADPQAILTPPELLKFGVEKSPLFEPGAKFDYSNTNTILLGLMIEKVTGKPIADAYETMVFTPLKLANTTWPGTSTAMPTPFAQGYTLQSDTATPSGPANATHWNPSWGWTAGEIISNMDDLLVFGRALGPGQGLLDAKTQAVRLTSFLNWSSCPRRPKRLRDVRRRGPAVAAASIVEGASWCGPPGSQSPDRSFTGRSGTRYRPSSASVMLAPPSHGHIRRNRIREGRMFRWRRTASPGRAVTGTAVVFTDAQ